MGGWKKKLDFDPDEEFDPEKAASGGYSGKQLEHFADTLLKADARELDEEGKARGIGGDNPILFEEHLYSRRRREIYTEVGVPDPSLVSGIFNRCVDELTQALTVTGWKTYDQLSAGELVWAFDPSTQTASWLPLLDVFANEYEGNIHVLQSENISARVTDGHRWIVEHERTRGEFTEVQSSFDPSAVAAPLQDRHYIPLRAEPANVDGSGRTDLMELLGWVMSDGTYHKEKASMVVYQALHNPKVAALRRVMDANRLVSEPAFVDQNNVGHWRIPAATGHALREVSPVKSIASISLTQLNHAEMDAFLTGVKYGDGALRPASGNRQSFQEITSTKISEADALQAMLTVQGVTSSIRTVENPKAFCPIEHYVSLKQTTRAYVRTARQEPEYYSGIVWCPTVDTGFWFARRAGKVYVTGNTHPQGRRVNTPEQRSRNGASFYR